MTLSVHATLKATLRRNLDMLVRLLDKAEAHATARQFDIAVLLEARLAPDMFALTRQVQIACDMAKGMAARLAGHELPAYEDVEKTLPELKQRIARTLAFVESIEEAAYADAAAREVRLSVRGNELVFTGQDYLLNWGLPNLYFHVTAVYLILRHNGVELGKRDFLNLSPA